MAIKNVDIALNNNDLIIQDGDFAFAESDQQHVIDTINAFPGWWKENPTDGVGLMAFKKASTELQTINRKIKIQLQSDGYNVQDSVVKLSPDGKLIINPNAIKQ